MPVLEVDTNVPASKITSDLVQEATKLMAKLLKVENKYMSVIFRPNPLMMWGGTGEPCAACRITAINYIDEQNNREYTKDIFKFMSDKLEIPGDRMYTIFMNPANTHVGFMGILFKDIMG